MFCDVVFPSLFAFPPTFAFQAFAFPVFACFRRSSFVFLAFTLVPVFNGVCFLACGLNVCFVT